MKILAISDFWKINNLKPSEKKRQGDSCCIVSIVKRILACLAVVFTCGLALRSKWFQNLVSNKKTKSRTAKVYAHTLAKSPPKPLPQIKKKFSQSFPKSLSKSVPEVELKIQLSRLGETEWLDNEHLWNFCKYLSTKYPHLFVPHPCMFYVADSITFGMDVSLKVLADLHLRGPCRHKEESEGFGPYRENCENKTIYYYPMHSIRKKPPNLGHWTGLLIDKERRTVEYYNSFVAYGEHTEIIQKLKNLTTSLSELDPSSKGAYQFSEKIINCLQTDGYECGVFVCFFIEKRLENPDVDFNTLEIDIHEYRKFVSSTICNLNVQ